MVVVFDCLLMRFGAMHNFCLWGLWFLFGWFLLFWFEGGCFVFGFG